MVALQKWGIALMVLQAAIIGENASAASSATIGAYYFEGWSDTSDHFHLTTGLINDFTNRKPIWGWYDDSVSIMQRQIDFAADNGVAFFAFCFYWKDDTSQIKKMAINSGINRFLQASNKSRMKFCFLVDNANYPITGTTAWKAAGDYWMPYFTNAQYLKTGGKPLIIIFKASLGDSAGFAAIQQSAVNHGLPGIAFGCSWSGDAKMYPCNTAYNYCNGWGSGSEQKEYSELVTCTENSWSGSSSQLYMPCIMAGWDNRPWVGPSGGNMEPASYYYVNRSPALFGSHVQNAVTWMNNHAGIVTPEHIAIIYAWNELGEGGYLVPNKEDSTGEYLKAIKAVVNPTNTVAPAGMTARTGASNSIYKATGDFFIFPRETAAATASIVVYDLYGRICGRMIARNGIVDLRREAATAHGVHILQVSRR